MRFWDEMSKSRERLSAIWFAVPGMCCANREELWSNMLRANFRATSSCRWFSTGLNVEWCNQPCAEELSVRDSFFKPLSVLEMLRYFKEKATVAVAAMNSSKLIDALPCKCFGISQRQASPSEVKPPKPRSEASEKQKEFGREKVM